MDPATGAVLQRPSSGDRSRLQAEQTSWASQSDKSMREFVELVSMGGKQVVQGAGVWPASRAWRRRVEV